MVAQNPQAPAPFSRSGNWSIIDSEYLPNIPVGWQVVAVEPWIQNGTTTLYTQVFMVNIYTHQSAVWMIRL